jgi:cytochrome c
MILFTAIGPACRENTGVAKAANKRCKQEKSREQASQCSPSNLTGKRFALLLTMAVGCILIVPGPAAPQPDPSPPSTSEPAVGLSPSQPAIALSPSQRRGFRLVTLHCARCHAIDKVGESPLAIAPAFRTLHLKYPVSDLQRPLAQGVHPEMPRFQLEAGQVEDIMAYLKTLEQ